MLQILKQPDHHFSRLLLLSHSVNTGLAAARNNAFASATSLRFVLDADNALFRTLSILSETNKLCGSEISSCSPSPLC